MHEMRHAHKLTEEDIALLTVEMLQLVKERTTEHERVVLTVCVPGTATVKQFMDVVYWCKNDVSPEETIDGEGIMFRALVKTEYAPKMIEALRTCGGGIVKGEAE